MQLADVIECCAGEHAGFHRDERERVIGGNGNVANERAGVCVDAAGDIECKNLRAFRASVCDSVCCIAVAHVQWAFQADAEKAVDDPGGLAEMLGEFVGKRDARCTPAPWGRVRARR